MKAYAHTDFKCGMQLSFLLIDQKFNVCTDGKKFSIQNLLRDHGHRRLKPSSFLLSNVFYSFVQTLTSLAWLTGG